MHCLGLVLVTWGDSPQQEIPRSQPRIHPLSGRFHWNLGHPLLFLAKKHGHDNFQEMQRWCETRPGVFPIKVKVLSSDRLACPSGPEEGRGQVGSKGDREMKRPITFGWKIFLVSFSGLQWGLWG